MAAPRRFSMIGCGSATTSAFMVRWHGATGSGAAEFAFGGLLLLPGDFSSRATQSRAAPVRSLPASGGEELFTGARAGFSLAAGALGATAVPFWVWAFDDIES